MKINNYVGFYFIKSNDSFISGNQFLTLITQFLLHASLALIKLSWHVLYKVSNKVSKKNKNNIHFQNTITREKKEQNEDDTEVVTA